MTITTVNANLPRVEYSAAGSQVDFTVPFEFFADADLKVYQVPDGVTPDDTTHLLTLTTHYTVTGAGVSDPGTRKITLVTGATLNDTIIIEGDDDIDRDTAFLNNGDLTIASMNQELNKLTMLNKQLSMLIARKTLQFQDSAILDGVDLAMPSPEALALLGWNSAGDALVNFTPYNEKYLGQYASAPATNPYTGAAPVAGDMYYDTTLNLMMVSNGTTFGQINSSVATAANAVTLTDAGGYFTDPGGGKEVESALQEIADGFDFTDPTINGEAYKRLVLLDTPLLLANASTDSGSWQTHNMSAGNGAIAATDGAKIAILRCFIEVESSNGSQDFAFIGVRPVGSSDGLTLVTQACRVEGSITSTSGEVLTDSATKMVNLDANSDFQYYFYEGTSGMVGQIFLDGYYV